MRKIYVFLLLLLPSIAQAQSRVIDTVGNTRVYIDSLIGFGVSIQNNPWDLHWGPDNKLWYTSANTLCRYDTGTGISDTLFLRNRASNGENIMSVATHPNFADSPFVYLTIDTTTSYYAGGGRIVLYKYRYSASGDSLYQETPVLSWYHPGEHCGGRVIAGHDHYLYVTTSEYWPANDSVQNLSGKILRVNLNGSIPAGNTNGYAFSYGHRNPQGIVQVPNGNIISSELGQTIDELNWIRQDRNYGWPVFDGDFCINIIPDSCTSPTFTYESPIDTAIRPPSGIDYYGQMAIPEFQGCVLQSILSFGGYQGGLVASKLNGAMNDVVSDVHYFKAEYGRMRDVCVSPDGKVYVITNDRDNPVIRVIYNPLSFAGVAEPDPFVMGIYPNPASDILTVSASEAPGAYSIYTIDGKICQQGLLLSAKTNMDVSGLAPGIYLLKSERGTARFVKL